MQSFQVPYFTSIYEVDRFVSWSYFVKLVLKYVKKGKIGFLVVIRVLKIVFLLKILMLSKGIVILS